MHDSCYHRCTFSQENFCFYKPSLAPHPIRTILTKVAHQIRSYFGFFVFHFEALLKSERSQVGTTLVLVLSVIILRGPNSNGIEVVGNIVRHYTEETSASISSTVTIDRNSPDISSLMRTSPPTPEQEQTGSFGGSSSSAQITTYTIRETDSAIQSIDSVSTDYLDTFKADEIIKYTVQPGDTIGSIASDFGVSINTIVWANSLKNPNMLGLGEVLRIPPVTGVIHTIKSNDTVDSIAAKYKADPAKILSFNTLESSQVLKIGDEIMVPGGELPGPKPVVKASSKGSGGSGIYVPVGDGQCVAFVQAHGFSSLHGNAYQWARYINTKVPTIGGVIVFKGGKYGHVALITAIKENSIQIVEQNYYGPRIIDHREISKKDKSIVGFIQ